MEDEVILMSPPGATGSKRHRFCKVEHNGKSYWVDLTATRRLRGIDSARLYTLKDGRLIVARLVRVSVLRVGDLMEDEVILMSPPGATGSKRHRFCKVEHNGKSYWVDLTATRRLRGIDSARLYTLKDGRLIVARLVRVSVLRSQGVI
jgi:hypothetical protein